MSRIAIVGGGIAGLTLAAALDQRRHEVTLFEEQPERAGAGAALALWPSAVRALDRIGVRIGVRIGHGEDAGAAKSALSSAALFDLDTGARLLTVPRRAGSLALIPRPALLAALEDAVPDSVRRVHEAVTDPAALDADLVVGADGVRSRVRGLVHPPAAERRQTPWLALRGIHPEPPDMGSLGEYWGPARLAGIAPLGAGTYWFTTHRSTLGPEPLDVREALAEARQRFADASLPVQETLAAAGPHTLATRLWLTPPLPRYARGRYVVVGDAAHATTPNLGRGAVDAILDAASLADTLNRGTGLRAWQLRRLPATQAARTLAPLVMRLALSESAAGPRNRVLRAAGRL
ncbi:FAD-dependent oxidoreductase [Ornithinimicrobium pratense]|uniref:FAD-dependent oxidoreductase n=1 Tax=Ornithinimicrobium pratense TaxID=2593973 RepID=A0A5J6VAJ2_9MICO|nr:FAD-dependent oxidoreductase [Ornithinimicrobium pratense]QFG70326.1 FAD-dependent oxidoreductase [Ornithinimicrobium pratense]